MKKISNYYEIYEKFHNTFFYNFNINVLTFIMFYIFIEKIESNRFCSLRVKRTKRILYVNKSK